MVVVLTWENYFNLQLHGLQIFLNFLFFLFSYFNNTRGFHCDNSIHVYAYLQKVDSSLESEEL
jgi:hypothetical protein